MVQAEQGGDLYLAGGVVRDLLLGQQPADIDLTVPAEARAWAARLASLTDGALVPLGRNEDAARVVCRGVTVDFSSFREGAQTIADDLIRRDLTINALACRIDSLLAGTEAERPLFLPLIDPTSGRADLCQGVIRVASPESFTSDPLRLVRVFRFAVTLGFSVEATTLNLVQRQCSLVGAVAPERVAHELDLIMAAPDAHATVQAMAGSGLLWTLFPELAAGIGMVQPKSHHLDVWEHNLETLGQMEHILAVPGEFYPASAKEIRTYLADEHRLHWLKWAALFHDLGKPATHALREDKGGRITFYNHDQVGTRIFNDLALRLRWSNEARERVGRLIAGHMRPFHLANVSRTGNLTLRAAVRMIRSAGDDLEGLFLLAMADSLAGQGIERIEGMEGELAALLAHLVRVRVEHVTPVCTAPPLLTGRDLIERLRLAPGPLFKRILAAVEEARMTGEVGDIESALQLAKHLAAEQTGAATTYSR
jgi:poly(A) polymerase